MINFVYKKIIKRIFDFLLSLVVLILFLPIFVVIGFFIKITSSGPVFFFQRRLGEKGVEFKIFKFRTMTHVPRKVNREIFNGDFEVTKFGAFLRRFKIDELPQIINILKGEMSFVGPRPCMPELKKSFNEDANFRLQVTPGLTGLAQVNGNIHLDWEKRWKLDRLYVENVSFFLDLKIILKTFILLVKGEKYLLKDGN